jgi:hypothetical protein
VVDGSFEVVDVFWAAMGGARLERTDAVAHSGSFALSATNRLADTWEGPGFPMVGRVTPGERYAATLWVLLGEGPHVVRVTFHHHCAEDESDGVYAHVAGDIANGDEWAELSGTIAVPDCHLNGATLYVEGAPVGVDVFVDDVSVTRITD